MVDILFLCVYLFGNIELLICILLVIKVGLGIDLFNFVICVILFGVLMYFVVNFLIKKFNYVILGCNGNYDNDSEEMLLGFVINVD